MGPAEACNGFRAHGTKAIDEKVIWEDGCSVSTLCDYVYTYYECTFTKLVNKYVAVGK